MSRSGSKRVRVDQWESRRIDGKPNRIEFRQWTEADWCELKWIQVDWMGSKLMRSPPIHNSTLRFLPKAIAGTHPSGRLLDG